MDKKTILNWLKEKDSEKLKELYAQASQVREEFVGPNVYLRGLIEYSNICNKNCYYCGIRKDNHLVERYEMSFAEVFESAAKIYQHGFGSVVLQSGERQDRKFIENITRIISEVKSLSKDKLRLTLSLGEQSRETLKKWFDAGAERYLLRMETSSLELYTQMHPDNHYYMKRLDCLKDIKDIGYQVGTGFLIGVPHQKEDDLYEDLKFLKDNDIDMIGMGPYLLHAQTSFASEKEYDPKKNLEWTLKMIALARLSLENVNIAATTALETLDERGRVLGLSAGANVIMPNLTPAKYRRLYQLYENKQSLDETHLKDFQDLIAQQGWTIAYHQWGDAPHYLSRRMNV